MRTESMNQTMFLGPLSLKCSTQPPPVLLSGFFFFIIMLSVHTLLHYSNTSCFSGCIFLTMCTLLHAYPHQVQASLYDECPGTMPLKNTSVGNIGHVEGPFLVGMKCIQRHGLQLPCISNRVACELQFVLT